jgi:NPCBM/NEW2 domain-containing protein
MGTPVNQKQPVTGGRRQRSTSEIVATVGAVFAVLGVVVAILAWQWPVSPGQTGTAGPGTSTAGTATSQPATTTQPSGTTRFLTEMTPLAGQVNIETKPDPGTFILHCGSGVSDPSKEVQYRLNGAYQKFEANVTVTQVEAPEDRTQFQVFADGVRLSNIVIDGKDSRPVSIADLDGAKVLALRLTCQNSETMVIVQQARVST